MYQIVIFICKDDDYDDLNGLQTKVVSEPGSKHSCPLKTEPVIVNGLSVE